MRTDMSEETVVVTGGASSVGRIIAEEFHKRGARVHVCDVDARALAEMRLANTEIRGTVANVGQPTDVENVFSEARAWLGTVSVLVNCVGIAGPRAAVENVAYDEWRETLDVNLGGMFYCIRQAVPDMKQGRHGAIINFSSASTRTGLPLRTPYVVSKFGVEGLTRNLARELGPFNVRCNALLPGMINNARMEMIMRRTAEASGKSVGQIEDAYLRYISMRTKIEPDELAEMVVFLASSSARHVTGQLIGVCGNVEWED